MHLVDIHAHLDDPAFAQDLDAVLARARAAGVVAIILQGVSHEKNLRLLELAARDPMLKVAFGLYPLNAIDVETHATEAAKQDHDEKSAYTIATTLAAMETHADRIVAIGEVGIDLAHSDDLQHQADNFREIVRCAKRLRKPLIIHSRKAEKEVLDILEQEAYTRAVLHCFTGNHRQLKRGVAMGICFSIPPAVVRNKQFQENAKCIPVGQLLTETDAPYMGPYRDLRNEPANVGDAVRKLAEIHRMEPEELANAIFFNYQRLFL